jgi:uncharacterized cupredoxin-like copper-binding protein
MPAGSVTFTVRDSGHLAHSFVVLRTNLPAGKLPMKGNQVDIKKAGTLVGQITDIKPGKTAHLSLTLKAGPYVLFCNLPAHYKSGQYAAFRVT